MSGEENKKRIQHYFEVVDSGDQAKLLALIDELMADDYVAHTAGATIRGREGLKDYARGVYTTFGNMQHIVEDNLADGDKVVTRVRFRAALKGEFLGIAPSGRQFECPVIYIHRFAGATIHEAWLDWDSLFHVSRHLGAA
jgi:predicted ester cyclase